VRALGLKGLPCSIPGLEKLFLSLQGGIGKSFLGGGLVIGAAYYAQWKLTEDELGSFVLPGGGTVEPELVNKHRVFAFGPDVTLPVATKTKLLALVNLR
jgi:hypothetical protein